MEQERDWQSGPESPSVIIKDRTPGSVRRLRTVVRLVVVMLVVVLSGLAVFFWVHTEKAAVSQFNRSSLQLARIAAKRIEETFVQVERRLLILSRAKCAGDKTSASCLLSDEEVLAEMRPLGGIEVLRTDVNGVALVTVAFHPEVVNPVLKRAQASCNAEDSFCFGITDSPPEMGDVRRLAVISLAQDPARFGHSGGRVAAVFDWNILGGLLTEEVALGPQRLAWIIDEKGKLLYHPMNPEVCDDGVQRQDERCQVCHKRSAVTGEMQMGKSGVGAIDVEGSVPKLVAFSPLRIGGRLCSLAVAAPYASVVADNRRVLIVAILISGALIGLFLLVTYFLDRENRRQISVLHQNQETIRQLNAQLETKVRERSDELSRVYNEISDFRRKHESRERLAIVGELASVVAHEIRTPLNSLAISSERLARKLRVEPGVRLEEASSIVQSQIYEINRINDYIEEYLRLSRLPRRRMVRSDLNQLIAGLLKFLEVEGRRLGVRIHFNPSGRPVVAEIDEEQIRQVLLNLVINAFQAMPAGGDLEVKTESADDQVAIRIRDSGVGIAKENLEEVFKPFFTTREGGTGLGLAICARIVSEHHGKLACESEVGHGTTFHFNLPVIYSNGDSTQGDSARG